MTITTKYNYDQEIYLFYKGELKRGLITDVKITYSARGTRDFIIYTIEISRAGKEPSIYEAYENEIFNTKYDLYDYLSEQL